MATIRYKRAIWCRPRSNIAVTRGNLEDHFVPTYLHLVLLERRIRPRIDSTRAVTWPTQRHHRMALSTGSNGREVPPRVSHPLLPLHWIAAAVETGNDGQRLIRIDHKHESVGKPPQQSTAMFLCTTGNCRGLAIMRSITASTTARKRRPKPRASFSYQSCASISSKRATRVKITGRTRGNAALARPSTLPR